MHLTVVLLRRTRLPKGHLFRGKYRLVPKVEPPQLRRLKEDFEIEEQNMLYLRHPYLTEAQCVGVGKALGKQEKRMQKFIDETSRIFKDDVTIAERLMHLRVKESWD